MNAAYFTTIMDMMDEYESSERIALICTGEVLTYRTIIADAKHIARGLLSEGVKKGDRILFCMQSSADAFRAMLGIFYAGAVCVTADPEWPEERIHYAAEDAHSVFSMTEESCRALRNKTVSYAQLPKAEPEEEAAIYYTSGSTGMPKGVVLRHGMLGTAMSSVLSSRLKERPELSELEISICTFRLPFVATLIDLVIIWSSQKTMLMPADAELYSVEGLLHLIRTWNPQVIASTPSIITRFLEHPEFARLFAGFRVVFFGGEPLTQAAGQRISQATKASVYVVYGSTEMFFTAEAEYVQGEKIHLGNPGFNVKLYLLDEKMEQIDPGQEGELYIGGMPAQYGHYLNRELDLSAYIDHPALGRLYRTGDLGSLGRDGRIFLVGRADRMVKLHGQRIEIGEVENAISSFPGVTRAAAMLQRYEDGDVLCGFYTAEGELDDRAIREHLSKRLPMYMIPSFLRYLQSMPVNAHGKLEYKKLPEVEKEKPQVSVLTPVHDVPMKILERSYKSLQAQSYASNRIQWLLAVHNMDDEYEEQVRALVKEDDRCRVIQVRESKRLVAAVRNVLLKEASGRYLFWLDADDELSRDGIRRSVSAMEQNAADMLLYPCEEIPDDGVQLFPRPLNIRARETTVYQHGDPAIGELLTGCAGEVWSWCFRRSFLNEIRICFNEGEVGHFCETLFVAEALGRAAQIVVLPEEPEYLFHIRGSSFSQSKVREESYETCRELVRCMERVRGCEEALNADFNQFLWFWVRNTSAMIARASMKPEQKQALYDALLPLVSKLRILTPGPVLPKDTARVLGMHVALLFADVAEHFQNPRIDHIRVSLESLPAPEDIRNQIRASSYTGFRTLPDPEQVFLGTIMEDALPDIVTVQIPGKEKEAFIQSYENMERMRGFALSEVPCRITLFHKEDETPEMLVTWDQRFLSVSAVRWLVKGFTGPSL